MKISVYIATSANGLISNSRNVPDWLSPEYGQGMYAISQKFKAVIMGKTTYNIIAPDHLPLKEEGTTIVLTTNDTAKPDNPTVKFTKEGPVKIKKMLEREGYADAVIIGGTMTISQFINAGLVDEIYFIVEPVLFDGGLPLLKNVTGELKLNLLQVSKLNGNTVQLHYQVEND
ncbi:dihydrofolate reductase family protein [Mucilaginibacter boryungensis]|uniref:Dihydrofolate reductase n=1 Tax=Mucilaginibacter boryungensis TaxID=768480 RepID=A0ABR9XK97_9SPHI|nr:dihydrofolate reductase family protein [Mucilaginibacter boryungensis]MBE9667803.1 dihydrofolate reductase [Mucilaginibacter boryungensis]